MAVIYFAAIFFIFMKKNKDFLLDIIEEKFIFLTL